MALSRIYFAPDISPDRVDRLPNDLELPNGIDPADHDGLRKEVIGVHDFLEAARCLYPLTIRRLANRIDVRRELAKNMLRGLCRLPAVKERLFQLLVQFPAPFAASAAGRALSIRRLR